MKHKELIERLATLQVGDYIRITDRERLTKKGGIIKLLDCWEGYWAIEIEGCDMYFVPIAKDKKCSVSDILLLREACTHHDAPK